MFSLYPILPRRGISAHRPASAPPLRRPAPSAPRPMGTARRGDLSLTGAALLAAAWAALLVGTYLFGSLPVAAIALGAFILRWALAAVQRPARPRSLD